MWRECTKLRHHGCHCNGQAQPSRLHLPSLRFIMWRECTKLRHDGCHSNGQAQPGRLHLPSLRFIMWRACTKLRHHGCHCNGQAQPGRLHLPSLRFIMWRECTKLGTMAVTALGKHSQVWVTRLWQLHSRCGWSVSVSFIAMKVYKVRHDGCHCLRQAQPGVGDPSLAASFQ